MEYNNAFYNDINGKAFWELFHLQFHSKVYNKMLHSYDNFVYLRHKATYDYDMHRYAS